MLPNVYFTTSFNIADLHEKISNNALAFLGRKRYVLDRRLLEIGFAAQAEEPREMWITLNDL